MVELQRLDMQELIDKLEATTRGSRELDRCVLLASGWHIDTDGYWWARNGNLGFHGKKETHLLPQPTTSINAALNLLSKGRLWSIGTIVNGSGFVVVLDNSGKSYRGATPALAVCIAALEVQLTD